jgi:flagellar motor switch protein FliM
VYVANKKQFYARVGKSHKRMGIQITGVYREHDDTNVNY